VALATLAPPAPTGNFIGRNTIGSDQTGRGGNGVDGVRLVSATANLIGTNEIMGNSGDGIDLLFSTNNQIYGNYIGTDGQLLFGNGGNGIDLVSGSTGSGIDNNLISGNALDGILADDTSGSTDIYANTIGLDAQFGIAIPNGRNGVHILGTGNTVGGTGITQGNVISGNAFDGVFIDGGNGDTQTCCNVITANFIGTDNSGTFSLGNGANGVQITGFDNNVGGNGAAVRHVISGNRRDGVLLGPSSVSAGNLVAGNFMGTDSTGTRGLRTLAGGTPSGNGLNGVEIQGSSQNTIGGAGGVGDSSPGNVISNNGADPVGPRTGNGVLIRDSGSTNNTVQGNYIGTDVSGLSPLGNKRDGVYVEASAGSGNEIGGAAANVGNVISANGLWGIELDVVVTEDFNVIGLDKNGRDPNNNMKNGTPGPPPAGGGSFNNQYGAHDQHQ
jgi:titin